MHGSNVGSNFAMFDGLIASEESVLDRVIELMECSSRLVKLRLQSSPKRVTDLDDNRRAQSAKRPDCIAKPQA